MNISLAALEAALEFNLRSDPDLELSRWLTGQGVDVAHCWSVTGPIVEHDIIAFPGRCFDFAEPGDPESLRAIVQVAHSDNAESPLDLVAWTREHPDRVLRCLARAPALGIHHLTCPASYFNGAALAVHRTPLAWLRCGCAGVIILDAAAFRLELSALPPREAGYRLAAENLAHGRALRDLLSPLPSDVRIVVPMASTRGLAA